MPAYNGTPASETINGSAGDDVIDGRGGNDQLFGRDGADLFIHRAGVPGLLDGGNGIDRVELSGGFHETDSIMDYVGPDTFYRRWVDLPYTLGAGPGGDALFSATQRFTNTNGNIQTDTVTTVTLRNVEAATFLFTETPELPNSYSYLSGRGQVTFSADDTLIVGNLAGTGLTGLIHFDGGTGDDMLDARAATNTLLAYGGTGVDRLYGGSADDTLSGEDGNDLLVGGAGANVLSGGAGSDTADYSQATQRVIIDLNDGTVANNGYGAIDTLTSIESLTGGAFDDVLIGEASNNRLTGNAGADYLIGFGGDDRLDGGSGAANTLQGGLGNDTYVVAANDTLIELVGEGVDTVETVLGSHTLRAHFENLTYTGAGSFAGTGNDLDNRIVGGAGADTLTGLAGNDVLGAGAANTLIGGAGNDRYVIRAAGDTLIELAGEGHDTVQTSLSAHVLGDNFEDLIFNRPGVAQVAFTGTGNASNNLIRGDNGIDVLIGLAGDDHLQGMEAADTLRGGAGNDRLDGGPGGDIDTADYAAAASGVHVNLSSGTASNDGDGGSDVLISIENLIGSAFNDVLLGSAAVNVLVGGTGSDTLAGYGGADILDGGAGAANTLIGGLGDDLYRVGAVGDTLVETADGGFDTVEATALRVTLGEHLEVLRFTGVGNFTGVGGGTANRITGGTGDDNLWGMAGNDLLEGGGGADVLDGGAGDDVLNGGGGSDRMAGGAGNDTLNGGTGTNTADYSGAAAGATVRLNAGTASDGDGGTDTLIGIANVVGSAFNDTLTGDDSTGNRLEGGAGRDVLIGLAGDDVLVGGSGLANELYGGRGDDRYVVTAVGDTIVEVQGEGQDTVETTLNAYTLRAHVEHLVFTGTGAFSGTGNSLSNMMTGGAGNDLFVGGSGDDIIRGQGGVDTVVMSGLRADYTIQVGADVVSIGDSVIGRDGIDTLYGIERIRFSDGTVLDITAPAPVLPELSDKLAQADADALHLFPGFSAADWSIL